MRVLISGDSITEGIGGYSYVDEIKNSHPKLQVVNLGLGGDTLTGIMKRTIMHLKENEDYDVIIISAGHNDIVLPYFSKQSLAHKFIVYELKRRGSVPTPDVKDFEAIYDVSIQQIQSITDARIIITTLSCLNEELSAETNKTRVDYNKAISAVAQKNQILLADVGRVFDEKLTGKQRRNYFMNNLINTFIIDHYTCRKNSKADALSTKRGFELTTDGVHLNSKGAQIYKECLCRLI